MRNVVVTGGSRGLGLGIARKLAGEGYHVIAVALKVVDDQIDQVLLVIDNKDFLARAYRNPTRRAALHRRRCPAHHAGCCRGRGCWTADQTTRWSD